MTDAPLLEIDGLGVELTRPDGRVLRLLDDVSLSLDHGGSLGVAGESGSGKTLLGLAIMGLLPASMRLRGTIRFGGEDLAGLDDDARSAYRGRRMAMIFQEPATALNPVVTVGAQIGETIERHGLAEGEAVRHAVVRLLERVRIADARRRMQAYPHQLSGGQRQRVMIAMALAGEPDLLIADEPTTAIDASVAGEILDLVGELVADGMAFLLISHDFGVVARACRRLMLLYAGTRLEAGPTGAVLADPASPYTRALIAARPRRRRTPDERLATIPGTVPTPDARGGACRFAGRCRRETDACRVGEPAWTALSETRGVRCYHPFAGELP